jgi:maltose alpha-D-glucosyltransferase/alpha-amylase
VLRGRDHLLAELDGWRSVPAAGMLTRVHGDYHLGQVLRTEDDFVILDFEGEPARPLEERRAKRSPLKDVAGMLRSFSYAAYAALFAFTLHSPADYPLLEPWAETWQHWVSKAFVKSYRATIGDSPLLPDGPQFDAVLRALMLEKALYELAYELNNRPDWVRIPLAGIAKLAFPLQS